MGMSIRVATVTEPMLFDTQTAAQSGSLIFDRSDRSVTSGTSRAFSEGTYPLELVHRSLLTPAQSATGIFKVLCAWRV